MSVPNSTMSVPNQPTMQPSPSKRLAASRKSSSGKIPPQKRRRAKNIYIFYEVLQDYTPGLAVASASSKKEAIAQIVKQFQWYKKHGHHQNPSPLCPIWDNSTFKTEVQSRARQDIPRCYFGIRGEDRSWKDFQTELEKARYICLPPHHTFGMFWGGGS